MRPTPLQLVFVGRTYRHYKGFDYQVTALATDASDTAGGHRCVVYKCTADGAVYVRPLAEFVATVTGLDGLPCARFALVEPVL